MKVISSLAPDLDDLYEGVFTIVHKWGVRVQPNEGESHPGFTYITIFIFKTKSGNVFSYANLT